MRRARALNPFAICPMPSGWIGNWQNQDLLLVNWFLPAVMSMISISIGQNPYLCRKCRQQVIDKSPVYVCYRTNVDADDDSNSTAPS